MCILSPPGGASPQFLLAAPASGVWRTGTPGSLATWRGCDAWLQRAVLGGLGRREVWPGGKCRVGCFWSRSGRKPQGRPTVEQNPPPACCLGMAESIWAVPENLDLDNAACKNRLWESVLIWMHGCVKMSRFRRLAALWFGLKSLNFGKPLFPCQLLLLLGTQLG